MTTFADLGLPTPVLERLDALGFETPTAVQEQSIPVLRAGLDLVAVAQTGTGKTAAYGLPMIAGLSPEHHPQGLVLAPTRELALQVADALAAMAPRGVRVLPIYGGSPFGPQLGALRDGVQIVVGTPGRVIDMLGRGALDLSRLSMLVLDEADEMLRMGFAEDVDQILAQAPTNRQTALFSATMPEEIRKVARTHMKDPEEIATARVSSTSATITQQYAVVPFRHKAGALARVLAVSPARAGIVFVRTRQAADEVSTALVERGINAAAISGDVAQKDRERLVERLRSGSLNVLVATDVAARGLDVERIDLVVNFDVPREPEIYVHRIGRTGRAGREGVALTFLTPKEQHRLRAIEKLTGTKLTEAEIPSPASVSAHRAAATLGSLSDRIAKGRLHSYKELLTAYVGEHDADPIEVAAALLAQQIGDTGPAPREEREDRYEEREERTRRYERDSEHDFSGGFEESKQREGRMRASSGTVYRVAVGRNQGARPDQIVGAITNEGGLRGKDIGKIDIYSNFSLVEITAPISESAMRRLSHAHVADTALDLRLDRGRGGRGPARGGKFQGSRDGARDSGPRRDGFRRDGGGFRREGGSREGGSYGRRPERSRSW